MRRNRFFLYVLLSLYLFTTGCAALVIGAGAGTAGYVWYQGKLEETFKAQVPAVHRAIRAGLKDLKINISEDKGDALVAEVRGLLADGRKVSVDAESVSASATKVTIRVGTVGELRDKELSIRIRDAIRKNL